MTATERADAKRKLLIRHGLAMRVVKELAPDERLALLLEVVSTRR
jgi:hypothetical protein